MSMIVVIRGAGDLASGAALRLYHCGIKVIFLELPEPLVVRRKVAFASAVFEKQVEVEGAPAYLAEDVEQALAILSKDNIAVIVDPEADALRGLRQRLPTDAPIVLVDGRMIKAAPGQRLDEPAFTVGLGPGFTAGYDCDAVVETNRGHLLGRVIWQGSAQIDTGVPERSLGFSNERVIRSPSDGVLIARAEIGDLLDEGQEIAEVSGLPIHAPFQGALRGLIHPGIRVKREMKIGDLDPRNDPRYCYLVSEKALAVGGGVLEAILARPELRKHLWD
ncbi:MAG: hypothetical protein B6D39_08230 [Anaerolineae bacterium UTCFX2]|jgi:xanthine dehydrogenase accessory factor|nr:MAG: hypothetical protein B6D39_08230 [Anaerolineae bacterium UTCFX2]